MPYLDPEQQRAAKHRSRLREIAAGRCTRCPRMNDAPEVNARLCSVCRKKDSAEKKVARKAKDDQIRAALQLFAALQKKRPLRGL